MAENSKIEWTDHTFNPWIGCTKISPACDHCYAEHLMDTRLHRVEWGGERARTSDANWRKPLAWNAEAKALGRRYRVFCASLADVFDNQVPAEWRRDLGKLIMATPHLDWLLLTKRVGNAAMMLGEMFPAGIEPNVWIGATICNQEEADRDIPKLLAVPARIRFLSVEPMLGPIDIERYLMTRGIHQVIAGGESGQDARPLHPVWPRSLRDQCGRAIVPFLFKQWGEWAPFEVKTIQQNHDWIAYDDQGKTTVAWPDGTIGWGNSVANRGVGSHLVRVGKRAAGRLLDGVQHDGAPA